MATDFNSTTDVSIVETPRGGFGRPVVWSAVIAGAVAALGAQLIFTLLGVGIGAMTANPAAGAENGATAMGIGAVIWLILSGILSFGLGGYVAGYVSSFYRTTSGPVHGMLGWALAAVLGAMVTTLAGSTALGGAAAGAGAAVRSPQATELDARAAVNDPQARANAEAAADAAGKLALWTGVAFLLSMAAAGAGGAMGRGGHTRVLPERRTYPSRLAGA